VSSAAARPIPVLWNSNAGQKVRGPLAPTGRDELQRVLDEAGVSARIVPTDSEDAAKQAVADEVKQGADLIIAAGGDGTVDLVGIELLGSDVALGILPLGSVMNVARMLGVPRDLPGAAAAIAARHEETIDVGEANGRVFFETASVGIQAAVFRHVQEWEHGDRLSVLRAIREAFRYSPVRMELVLDDSSHVTTRALMITISNAPYVGVAMTVAPDARLDDGKFDVVVWEHYSKRELLTHLASIAFGRRRYSPHSSTHRAASVTVVGRKPLPCRADAQDLGTTPLECKVRKGALRVVVGPGYANGRAAPEDANSPKPDSTEPISKA
jgi:diacylglycerol kinase (ATP)